MDLAQAIASTEALLASLRAMQGPAPAPTVPTLLPQDPRFSDQSLPADQRARLLGDVLAPYLSGDGKYFARDFWMKGLLGAMVGASVADYNQANIILGMLGGTKPRELAVVGPDVEGLPWNEVMTSPGTIGWNPLGASYAYNNQLSASDNYAAWIAAGAPKVNALGKWANGGLPQAYVEETWKHPSERDLDQPGFPGAGKKNRGRNR
jgi:hypothetical protein